MKRTVIFFVVITLFFRNNVFAYTVLPDCGPGGIYLTKCGPGGINPSSANQSLPANGVILLEFSGSSEVFASQLNKTYNVFLEASNHKINLTVKEILKGDFNVTQVVLVPANKLQLAATYTLNITNLPRGHRGVEVWDGGNPHPYTFTAVAETNISTKALTGAPVVTKKTLQAFGCGPAAWLHYNIGTGNDEPFVRTYIKNLTTGHTTEFIIAVTDHQFQVGHGMCDGPFQLSIGTPYEISFAPVNFAGVTGERTTAIQVKAPSTYSN